MVSSSTRSTTWLAMTFAFMAVLITCDFLTGSVAFAQETRKDVSVPASVRAYQSVDLYSKLGGYLSEVSVDIGDKVKKGDVLAKIEVPELEIQVLQKKNQLLLARAETQQADARVEEARAQLASYEAAIMEAKSGKTEKIALHAFEVKDCQRVTNLVSRGSIQKELVDASRLKCQSAQAAIDAADARIATAKARLAAAHAVVLRAQADVAASQAKVEVAQSELAYSEELINYTTIKAPFDGEIALRMYDPGAFVQNAQGNSAAKPILQLVSTGRVRLSFSLSMSQISGVTRGDKVVLTKIDALPGQEFTGEVSRFSAALDPKTRMMMVEVDLDNPDGKLKPGYFGYAKLKPSR